MTQKTTKNYFCFLATCIECMRAYETSPVIREIVKADLDYTTSA